MNRRGVKFSTSEVNREKPLPSKATGHQIGEAGMKSGNDDSDTKFEPNSYGFRPILNKN